MKQSISDLKRIATAKHGEQAYCIACRYGDPRTKEAWQKAIDTPVASPEQQADHIAWQQSLRHRFPWLPKIGEAHDPPL